MFWKTAAVPAAASERLMEVTPLVPVFSSVSLMSVETGKRVSLQKAVLLPLARMLSHWM